MTYLISKYCAAIYVIFNLYEMFHTIFVGIFMIIFVPDFTQPYYYFKIGRGGKEKRP
jgi:hypothetical protein